jgi:hypothetical protein
MALETISQVLSPSNAPYVNGVAARLKFSPALLKNMYQALVETNGKGIDDNFVTSTDAEENAQVIVHRILPVEMNPREMGASKNGGSYSQNQHYVQTTSVSIELLQVIDSPVKIPRARQDMIKTALLAEQIQIFSDRLATIINGATAACKLLASWNLGAGKYNGAYISDTEVANSTANDNKVLNKFVSANSILDEGDEQSGIDIFPLNTRIAVLKMSYRAILKTKGVLVIGGANDAYAIAAGAGLNKEGTVRTRGDGYWGDIDGIPVHGISNESLGHASRFMGLTKYDLKSGQFIGYISSSYANARGVSTSRETKVVDETEGQGIILQPYVKFGLATWYPKGNVILTKSEGWNPIDFLKNTIFSSYKSDLTFKLKGAGSRLYPVIVANAVTFASATAFSCVTPTALDDFNQDHLVALAWVATDAADGEITTVSAFCDAYKAATGTNERGIGTSLSSVTVASRSAGDFVTVLAIASDGSCSVKSFAYSA